MKVIINSFRNNINDLSITFNNEYNNKVDVY